MGTVGSTVATQRPPRWWHPFHDPSRTRRLVKVVAWLAGIALVVALLELLGVDVRGWFSDLWDALTEIPLRYQLAGWSVQTVQTALTALAWYSILRAGFPGDKVSYRQVLAAYATGVALNGFLPANIGTPVSLLMFVAIIPSANLAGVVGGAAVRRSSSRSPGRSSTSTCSRRCRARSSSISAGHTTIRPGPP